MRTNRLKEYKLADTIAALATFPSPAALGIIKISGKKALDVVSKIFIPKNEKSIKEVKTYTMHYGWISESLKNRDKIIDEVIVSIMKGPNSYTMEDVVEISCHGGVLALNNILELILRKGARLALPGEFTYRALVRGRIDLLQAESIVDIIEAKSDEGLKLAATQLRGDVSQSLDVLKEEIIDLVSQTEAYINFPEDDVNFSYKTLQKDVSLLDKRVAKIVEASCEASVLKEGLRCVICGKTNAGKSTLFNRLLKEERVLVSRMSGTTRDVIEETINIKGVPLRIYDTAGLLEPKDIVTKKAIEKTTKKFAQADLVILVLDGSKILNKDDKFLLEKIKNKNAIVVINKCDLKQKLKAKDLGKDNIKVKMSALKNFGVTELEQAVFNCVHKKGCKREDMIFLNQYQKDLLSKIKDNLSQCVKFFDEGSPIDFVNLSLRSCLEEVGKIKGEVLSEEILENIFSRFCIGK